MSSVPQIELHQDACYLSPSCCADFDLFNSVLAGAVAFLDVVEVVKELSVITQGCCPIGLVGLLQACLINDGTDVAK